MAVNVGDALSKRNVLDRSASGDGMSPVTLPKAVEMGSLTSDR